MKSGAVAEEKLLEALARVLHLAFTRITDNEIEAAARAANIHEFVVGLRNLDFTAFVPGPVVLNSAW